MMTDDPRPRNQATAAVKRQESHHNNPEETQDMITPRRFVRPLIAAMIMSTKTTIKTTTFALLAIILCLRTTALADEAKNETFPYVGLVLHVGCGDGSETVKLLQSGASIVHGLDQDDAKVKQARARFIDLAGTLVFDHWDGKTLPYPDNTVNRIRIDDMAGLARVEIERALAPRGVVMFPDGKTWIKPSPTEMDDWTHFHYDSRGNAVSEDRLVAPPTSLRWRSGPNWTRHHESMSSLTALVSSDGKLFYIMDEGSSRSILMPPKWTLTCRDAFNGITLWKRELPSWYPYLWPLKHGPAQLPRRLVAIDGKVYLPLGRNQPLSVLDANTGKTLNTLSDTVAVEEILIRGHHVLVLDNERPDNRDFIPRALENALFKETSEQGWEKALLPPRVLKMFDGATGDLRWKIESEVTPISTAMNDQVVCFQAKEHVVCLDRATGEERWRAKRPGNFSFVKPARFLIWDDILVVSDGSTETFSLKDGSQLWKHPGLGSSYLEPKDIFVMQDAVWEASIAYRSDVKWIKNKEENDQFLSRDPHTGTVLQRFRPEQKGDSFSHRRCYPSKATQRFYIASRTGVEFIDPKTEILYHHNWVRGACLYGVMPANGLLYATPNPCVCYVQSKLNGFNALAATGDHQPIQDRLVKGPAYSKVFTSRHSPPDTSSDWPTYRHDPERSGVTSAALPENLAMAWETVLPGRLSAPTVADGRVYVAQIDSHILNVLNAENGAILWRFVGGGRIDSPPTIADGRVVFGGRDGKVYCLDATSGEIVWIFTAATNQQKIVADERLESLWPVHGAVLVDDGEVYCVAGRSMFLDGGLTFYRLDLKTGNVLSRETMDGRHPESGIPLDRLPGPGAETPDPGIMDIPGALPDILIRNGDHLFMRSQIFDRNGKRLKLRVTIKDEFTDIPFIHAPAGLLDDSGHHRQYWALNKGLTWRWGRFGWLAASGAPVGSLLVYDDSFAYAYGRLKTHYDWRRGLKYRLYAQDVNKTVQHWQTAQWETVMPPIQARAMLKAGDRLFLAGPPDVLDENHAHDKLDDPNVLKDVQKQQDAYDDRMGALLWIVDTKNGQTLKRIELPAAPVWDGMAATDQGLFMTTTKGQVMAFKP